MAGAMEVIGLAKGKLKSPENLDQYNDEIAEMFGGNSAMNEVQRKVHWQGEVVSIQPRSTVWRYLIDNRTHREIGFNVFLKGDVYCEGERLDHESSSSQYDYCVAISEKQAEKIAISIGDELKGTGWTKLYPEVEFADYYRAGGLVKVKEAETGAAKRMVVSMDDVRASFDGTPIPRVNSADYPGPPWKVCVPPLAVYAWRGARMLSKSAWKGKCFQCIWANMANVCVQYDFGNNLVRNRFETFCYGPLSCRYYSMGPARTVPYKGMSGIKDQGWLDEVCVEYRSSQEE